MGRRLHPHILKTAGRERYYPYFACPKRKSLKTITKGASRYADVEYRYGCLSFVFDRVDCVWGLLFKDGSNEYLQSMWWHGEIHDHRTGTGEMQDILEIIALSSRGMILATYIFEE